MRAVADGNIEEEVLIDGPPEVAAIGRDAESMRRRIVAELDASTAASEALTQHSPVVSLLRQELTSHPHAGHPSALVVDRHHRDIVTELTPTGPLISSVTSGWTVTSTLFGPDDMLLACTDGVLEARDSADEEFGTAGLLAVLGGLTRWSADEAVVECREAVRRFAVDVRRDDVTCVALTLATSRAPV